MQKERKTRREAWIFNYAKNKLIERIDTTYPPFTHAEVNCKDKHGLTPMWYAVDRGG